jgi:hypothetical protein
MKRRVFIALGCSAGAYVLTARAQQDELVRQIGVLMTLAADDLEGQRRLSAFQQKLQELGWTVGRNVQMDERWAGADANNIRKYAEELVALTPHVIQASGSVAVGPSPLVSMRSEPNPLRFGTVTNGPPVSCQVSLTLRSSPLPIGSHATCTPPVPLDNAPYLLALVASSCRHRVRVSDACARTHTAGPSMKNRSCPDWNGLIARSTTWRRDARSQFLGGEQLVCLAKSAQTRKEGLQTGGRLFRSACWTCSPRQTRPRILGSSSCRSAGIGRVTDLRGHQCRGISPRRPTLPD